MERLSHLPHPQLRGYHHVSISPLVAVISGLEMAFAQARACAVPDPSALVVVVNQICLVHVRVTPGLPQLDHAESLKREILAPFQEHLVAVATQPTQLAETAAKRLNGHADAHPSCKIKVVCFVIEASMVDVIADVSAAPHAEALWVVHEAIDEEAAIAYATVVNLVLVIAVQAASLAQVWSSATTSLHNSQLAPTFQVIDTQDFVFSADGALQFYKWQFLYHSLSYPFCISHHQE